MFYRIFKGFLNIPELVFASFNSSLHILYGITEQKM